MSIHNRHSSIMKYLLFAAIFLSIIFSFFPNYGMGDDERMWKSLDSVISTGNHPYQQIPVMSFNVRLDGLEEDPNNHFTKRVSRISRVFNQSNPWIVGLQEPFAGQLLHLQSLLCTRYKEIGYNGHQGDLGQPSRHNDFKVAMMYDSSNLKLLNQDYIWLSQTPRREESRDWNTSSPRVLNMARFKIKKGPLKGEEIIAFNTHLDVKSELARRKQSKIVAESIVEWRTKYPKAFTVLFGDFNTAPGQAAYQTLTAILDDSWIDCKSTANCISNDFSSSFHGWQGSRMNYYWARALQGVAFTLYGWGLNLPQSIPSDLKSLSRAVLGMLTTSPQFSLWDSIPFFPWNRFHVDWILYKSPTDRLMKPQFSSIMDVKTQDYSSDHFPLVVIFELSRTK